MARKRTHSFGDDTRGPRLQRVLAAAGVGSRRHCEELIEAGVVRVNGELVDSLPAWVDPLRDRIEVEGRLINRKRERPVYVMLHKPRGTVSTNRDPEGRPRAIDLVRHPDKPRLYPVGRLDMDSSGLLLLTNDGELANRLTHPRYEVHKGYEVLVGGQVADADIKRLSEGIFLPERRGPGSRTARSKLELIKRDRERTLLYMELHEGRNRQVRRMLQRVGHPVKRLRRVRMGPLVLKGLAVGEWRELTAAELAALRRAAGLGAPGAPSEAPAKSASTGKPRSSATAPRQPRSPAESGSAKKRRPTEASPSRRGPRSRG